jgi:hypothetical protein
MNWNQARFSKLVDLALENMQPLFSPSTEQLRSMLVASLELRTLGLSDTSTQMSNSMDLELVVPIELYKLAFPWLGRP